jgi:PII-like signaling protein
MVYAISQVCSMPALHADDPAREELLPHFTEKQTKAQRVRKLLLSPAPRTHGLGTGAHVHRGLSGFGEPEMHFTVCPRVNTHFENLRKHLPLNLHKL